MFQSEHLLVLFNMFNPSCSFIFNNNNNNYYYFSLFIYANVNGDDINNIIYNSCPLPAVLILGIDFGLYYLALSCIMSLFNTFNLTSSSFFTSTAATTTPPPAITTTTPKPTLQRQKCSSGSNSCPGSSKMSAVCKEGYCVCTGNDYDYNTCLRKLFWMPATNQILLVMYALRNYARLVLVCPFSNVQVFKILHRNVKKKSN